MQRNIYIYIYTTDKYTDRYTDKYTHRYTEGLSRAGHLSANNKCPLAFWSLLLASAMDSRSFQYSPAWRTCDNMSTYPRGEAGAKGLRCRIGSREVCGRISSPVVPLFCDRDCRRVGQSRSSSWLFTSAFAYGGGDNWTYVAINIRTASQTNETPS